MPFCHLALRGPRPLNEAYPASLVTVGDHIRKRRLDLGLFQRQAAERIGVTASTVNNWEKHRSAPGLREWPSVIRFLGYLPFEVDDSPAALIKAYRLVRGLSQYELAKQNRVDESTAWRWESGLSKVPDTLVQKAKAVVDSLVHPDPPVH